MGELKGLLRGKTVITRDIWLEISEVVAAKPNSQIWRKEDLRVKY